MDSPFFSCALEYGFVKTMHQKVTLLKHVTVSKLQAVVQIYSVLEAYFVLLNGCKNTLHLTKMKGEQKVQKMNIFTVSDIIIILINKHSIIQIQIQNHFNTFQFIFQLQSIKPFSHKYLILSYLFQTILYLFSQPLTYINMQISKVQCISKYFHQAKQNKKQEISSKKQKFIHRIFRQNSSFVLFGLGQIILVLGFIYPNQNKMHFIQSSIARGLPSCFISYFLMKIKNKNMCQNVIDNNNNFKSLFLRNILIIIYSNVYALSQLYLSQPVVQTINCTGPLFTFLVDYIRNGIQIRKIQALGILFVVIGGLLIANQKLMLYFWRRIFYSHQAQDLETDNQNIFNLFIVIVLFIAVGFWGVSQTLIKQLKNVDCSVINMHFAVLYMISNGIGYPLLVQNPLQPQKIFYAIFLCGIPTTIAAILMIVATKLTKQAGILSSMSFISVITGYALSVWRYDQPVNLIGLCGSVSIVAGLGTIILQKNQSDQ